MKVDDTLILKLQSLAKLELSHSEKVEMGESLEKIIDMFDVLSEVDTEDVEPLIYLNQNINRLRISPKPSNESLEVILDNAPKSKDNFFLVPKVID